MKSSCKQTREHICQGKSIRQLQTTKHKVIGYKNVLTYIHLSKKMELVEIQAKARCNWCLNALKDSTESLSEDNFIDTGKKFKYSSEPATSLYCNECLNSEFRVSQPKAAIDRNTLTEINIEDLV